MKKQVDGLLEDDVIINELLTKYESMVHGLVRKATTSAVCGYEDLCQEGRMAIINAYQTYDDNKGASFDTWVYNNIKNALLEYQKNNLGFLSGGEYLYAAIKKAGKNASVEDLMKLGLSRKTAAASFYFMLQPATYGEAFNMIDRKAAAQLKEIESFGSDYRKYLTEKEIFAIEHYFGLDNQDFLTMEDIGKILGKSRKAVSYLINQAIVKLRHVQGIEEYVMCV
jgi:RNA polymerase sigma factor (sigma-70 family)